MLPAVSNTEKDRRGAHVCGKKGLTGAIDSSYFFFWQWIVAFAIELDLCSNAFDIERKDL